MKKHEQAISIWRFITKKKKFFNQGKQNEKGRLRMTETLAKRHTKQSEKHVTVYLLENGFQVA